MTVRHSKQRKFIVFLAYNSFKSFCIYEGLLFGVGKYDMFGGSPVSLIVDRIYA
jgi:hypothetical protein